MKIPKFPTVDEIHETKQKIESRLSEKAMNMFKNAHVKEGYTDCMRILNEPDISEEEFNEWEAMGRKPAE